MFSRDGRDLHDDMNALGQEWQVRPDEDMFFWSVHSLQAPERCISPDAQMKETRRLGEGNARATAEKACGHLKGPAFAFCVHDVMVSGNLDVAGGLIF